MERSNVSFISLGDGLVASTHRLEFDGKLAVETESKELLCVGNASRGKVKVQLVESEKEREKATYRAQPDVVVLVRPAGANCWGFSANGLVVATRAMETLS